MTHLGQTEIEVALLQFCEEMPQKVAMVIVRATNLLANKSDDWDALADRVADVLYVLVEAGMLKAAGDITDWRHSEVRLPKSDE